MNQPIPHPQQQQRQPISMVPALNTRASNRQTMRERILNPALEQVAARDDQNRAAIIVQQLANMEPDRQDRILMLVRDLLDGVRRKSTEPEVVPTHLIRKSDGAVFPYSKPMLDSGKFEAHYDGKVPEYHLQEIKEARLREQEERRAILKAKQEQDQRDAAMLKEQEAAINSIPEVESSGPSNGQVFEIATAPRPDLMQFIKNLMPEGEKFDFRQTDEKLRDKARELAAKYAPDSQA